MSPSTRSKLSIHPSPAQLRALKRRDPKLAAVMAWIPAYPGFPTAAVRRMTHFQYLSRAIIYQQLAGKAAATIAGRVADLSPGRGLPRPTELANLTDTALRGAGLSNNKLRALRDLCERVLDKRLKLHGIGSHPDDEIVEQLVEVRGIGEWTAQMFLLFRLGRLDVLPTNDLAVQEGLRRLDQLEERPTPKEVADRGQVWAPLSSVAAWVMWRMTDTDPPD